MSKKILVGIIVFLAVVVIVLINICIYGGNIFFRGESNKSPCIIYKSVSPPDYSKIASSSGCDFCIPYESTNEDENNWCVIGEEIEVYKHCSMPDKLIIKGLTWITMPDGGSGQYCVAERIDTNTQFSINRVYFKEDKSGYDCNIMFQPHQRLDCFGIRWTGWPCIY